MIECLPLASLSNLVKCNTLAYLAMSKVTKEMECCEYGPWHYTKTSQKVVMQGTNTLAYLAHS
jgi:hypothetical protein